MMKVASVNAGPAVTVDIGGEPVPTAIFKYPVSGRIAVRGVNLAGDDQADRENHGGPDRSLYAYASEDIAWWGQTLARSDITAGSFGENLTTLGLDVNAALIGERWRIGTALFEVSQPRIPCFKLAMRLNEPKIVRLFAKSLRTGTYLRIIEEGAVAAGDAIEIEFRPGHEVSIRDFAEIYFSKREDAGRLLEASALSEDWRSWAMQQNEP
ncbi:MAG: MOSC domain-containing protein [Candidatus Eremiobacteraeota bacterium]|nr:MOSC domain-containing protein [Candidatus Eremiobacteraeota bacterium]